MIDNPHGCLLSPSHPFLFSPPVYHTRIAPSAVFGRGEAARRSIADQLRLAEAERGLGEAARTAEGDGLRHGLHPADALEGPNVRRIVEPGQHLGVPRRPRGVERVRKVLCGPDDRLVRALRFVVCALIERFIIVLHSATAVDCSSAVRNFPHPICSHNMVNRFVNLPQPPGRSRPRRSL